MLIVVDLLVWFLGVVCLVELLSSLGFLYRNRKFIFAQRISRKAGGEGHFLKPRARKYQRQSNLFLRVASSTLGLGVCGVLLTYDFNFEQLLVSFGGSKNVVIVALMDFFYELGEGFCRVAYEHVLTILTDNISCDPDSYLKLGLGTAVGIVIAVYVMIKLRTYIIFHNF